MNSPGPEIIYSPADFVASLNQTLEFAYGSLLMEGEIANFKVSKNRWVYFDIKDELASVRCFGTVYQLPGPLQDGLTVRLRGTARMHQQFGFSINLQAIVPVGQGALRKAADLLLQKLQKEGLFDPSHKRVLPAIPASIGLITSSESAAYADFIKIINERWAGVDVLLADVQVQGESAAGQIIAALDYFNQHGTNQEVVVITRGGGSTDDLAVFSDERVVRAIAASRIPTMVAIGHEVDESLAELAADSRASTPSNAAQLLVPDKQTVTEQLSQTRSVLGSTFLDSITKQQQLVAERSEWFTSRLLRLLHDARTALVHQQRIFTVLSPEAALARGYALLKDEQGQLIRSISMARPGQNLQARLSDGTIVAKIISIGAINGD
jgi:exodeoxyribonuclease VII large subunit